MRTLLREVWRDDGRRLAGMVALNILSSLLGGIGIVMLIPLLHMLDVGEGDPPGLLAALPHTAQIVTILVVYILLVVLKALLGRAMALIEASFVEDMGLRLRGRLYDAFTQASWEKLAAWKSADAVNLFTVQCGQVSHCVSMAVHMLAGVVSAAVQLGIALWMSAPVTLLVCALGGAMIAIFHPLRQKSREYGQEMIRINRDFYEELQNQLAGMREVRAYGVEREHVALFGQVSAAFKAAHLRYTRLCAVPSMAYSIAAAVLIAGVYLVCSLLVPVAIDRLLVLVYVFARLWPLFSGFQGQLQGISSCIPAYEKLSEAIAGFRDGHEEHEAPERQADFSSWREAQLEHVSFAYSDTEEPTLRDVSFSLRRGSVTALVGANGTGKSTTVNLLLGFLMPRTGSVTVDGRALQPGDMRAWRRQAGYVPQEPLILNASIRENLTRFHPSATDEEIIEVLKSAMAWEFIRRMPDGLDTTLGERGLRLSGGERQRIVLARVLLGKPSLILLDEATSALDYESERAFQEAIRRASSQAAVVLITHRLATIRMADQVVVLADGRVAEQGALAALLSRDGGYLAGMVEVR